MSLHSHAQKMQNENAERLTNSEAAEYLGLKIATLNKWRVYGDGPPYLKVGRLIQYRKSDLDAYLNERLMRSTSELLAR
ncbi:MAG: hypothetical protein DHS20C05_17970 [Hyphococcus sp.]|nr:MAG: hypothetical protein DHS20C05_17970 [Marinicaulis sp.]